MVADVTIGFVKDAKHHVDVQGFNVYHKNRLIKVLLLSFFFSVVIVFFLGVLPCDHLFKFLCFLQPALIIITPDLSLKLPVGDLVVLAKLAFVISPPLP